MYCFNGVGFIGVKGIIGVMQGLYPMRVVTYFFAEFRDARRAC